MKHEAKYNECRELYPTLKSSVCCAIWVCVCACYLRSGKPAIFVLSVVHVPVKGVELAVTEVAHVH